MPISTGLNSHRIRVGIILAEDRQTSVSASWDPGQLLDGSENLVDGAHSLEISVVNGALRLGDGDAGKVMDRLALRVADDVQVLRPGHGVTLDPVRTGRGFHWQKNIRVTLPGELIFGVRNGFLEVVNHVDVESYVACVATSEMGAAAPAELLGPRPRREEAPLRRIRCVQ